MGSGLPKHHASGLAAMQMRIEHWPTDWGDDLNVLIYGDFVNPDPSGEMKFPSLGITIEPKKIKNTIIHSATCILKARVTISEKSVNALIDASARISTLLGIIAAINWGNGGMGWWSYVTHGTAGGVMPKLETKPIQDAITDLEALPTPVASKIRSALYWMRAPRSLIMEQHRGDTLRLYAGYWNAFECLVDAVCLLRPQVKLPRADKEALIESFIKTHQGKVDLEAFIDCYKSVVDPGFVGKASHALTVCFLQNGEKYVDECFRMTPSKDRLYAIRNAINHGDVDAENPSELLRIEGRFSRLWMIVVGMLGRLITIGAPLDPEYATPTANKV